MREEIYMIQDAWCEETRSPSQQDAPMQPRACGQCAVTALVVQDLCGGDILRAEVIIKRGRRVSHYWNRIPGVGEIDLTRAQFDDDQPIPRGGITSRVPMLDSERAVAARTRHRYEILVERYKALREARKDW